MRGYCPAGKSTWYVFYIYDCSVRVHNRSFHSALTACATQVLQNRRHLILLAPFLLLVVGWRGDSCSLPRCRDTCDPVGGTCSVPGGCECNLGYSGPNCDIGKCISQISLFIAFHHKLPICLTEGLGIKFAYTSSLARVADYQNATLFLDISDNSAFSRYRVGSTHVALVPTALIDCIFVRFPSCPTTQAQTISLLSYRVGTNAQ